MTDSASTHELPGLDLVRLREHLEAELPGLTRGPLTGEVVQGGRSNLTYIVGDGTDKWVVRRPPLGHVLATAHDMSREYRVMTALRETSVPVPRTHLLCQDEEVIGAPFYVMEYVAGTVVRTPEDTDRLTLDQRRELSFQLMDVLADLHEIAPQEVGLEEFGRPDGFLERQVRRWNKQLAASQNREIEGVAELAERLAETVPTTRRSGIVHGDYRLDNVIIDANHDIRAVLDWEMATLGDPLTDLGLLIVYWDGFGNIAENPVVKGVGPQYGYPTSQEILDRYAARSGADLSQLHWYIAFGYFKIAVILEGIHYRYTQQQTVGEGFDHVGALVAPLVAEGLSALDP
ncbi:phosphotransferase family protein [Parasphingorhabdus pacifica]